MILLRDSGRNFKQSSNTSGLQTMASRLRSELLEFVWSAWVELGVSGWVRQHSNWYIDPEALLLLTGGFAEDDPRLWGESLDWAAQFGQLLSRARVRSLLRTWDELGGWPKYAAALTAATGKQWPRAEGESSFRPTDRSRMDLRASPALLGLRLRAAFGVSARSEILRILLVPGGDEPWTAAELAEEAGYTKRNVADALDRMSQAGLLYVKPERNTLLYGLRRPNLLEELVGPLPAVKISFLSLCRALSILVVVADQFAASPSRVRSVEARKALNDTMADLHRLGLQPPSPRAGVDAWEPFSGWVEQFLAALLVGKWPGDRAGLLEIADGDLP
jgi:hypothetical protein